MRKSAPIVDDGTRKRCPKCERSLPYSAFSKQTKSRDGLSVHCRECHSQYWNAYQEIAKPMQRTYHLRRSYKDFSEADYQALFELQKGLCAACGHPSTTKHYGKTAPLAVDHDHITGEVRGLLCIACNRALGYLNDSPERIKGLLRYIESVKES
jgi:hypothetical protein